jgi:hypothetical protein
LFLTLICQVILRRLLFDNEADIGGGDRDGFAQETTAAEIRGFGTVWKDGELVTC